MLQVGLQKATLLLLAVICRNIGVREPQAEMFFRKGGLEYLLQSMSTGMVECTGKTTLWNGTKKSAQYIPLRQIRVRG